MPWADRRTDRQHAGSSDEFQEQRAEWETFQVSDRERFHVFKLSLVPWLGRGEVEGLGISEPKAALNSLNGNREREATGNSAGRCHQRASGGQLFR